MTDSNIRSAFPPRASPGSLKSPVTPNPNQALALQYIVGTVQSNGTVFVPRAGTAINRSSRALPGKSIKE
jgi:hypothetical protein